MGLTIHYQLATTGDEDHARGLVRQLRQAALDLPFQYVGEMVDLQEHECDGQDRPEDDPFRWLRIQACRNLMLSGPATKGRRRRPLVMEVPPIRIIGFETHPGEGCEPANFGLCRYPSAVAHPEFGNLPTKLSGWSWWSCCKTHYASDPNCGGLPNFLRCHLGLVALLDEAKRLGALRKVSDESAFWETRSVERLTQELGVQSAMMARVFGVLKDALDRAPDRAGSVQASIAAYPDFERLEAEGQRLLPERLNALLKALAKSGLLRGGEAP